MKKLFDDRANFGIDYSHIQEVTNYIQDIEIIPLKIEDEDYEHYPEVPNAYGVYLRYSTYAIESLKLNPSEWLADFDRQDAAQAFKGLIYALLTGHMKEDERQKLPYHLPAGWAKPASQVSAPELISDELQADTEGKWKDIKSLGYNKNHLNDGRAEQWQLFVTPLTDYLMLDSEGDVSEYIYFSEADMEHDIEIMMEKLDSFTEL